MIQSFVTYGALNATETSETKVGSTIQIPPAKNGQSNMRIVGVFGQIHQPTATAAEVVSGYFRVAPGQTSGNFQFPAQAIAGPAGTLASTGNTATPQYIPVSIPVVPNDQINIYMTGNAALTGTGAGFVGFLLDDGS